MRMTDDRMRMTDGGMRMTDGGMRMADGGMRMTEKQIADPIQYPVQVASLPPDLTSNIQFPLMRLPCHRRSWQ